MPTIGELRQMQSLPLELKILKSQQRIREWYEHWDGNVAVSFSGGKDSTVLLHIVRSIYPDMPAVFVNTGLEFPEIVSFVKQTPNVTILRPKMPFTQVIEKYGYPVISKQQAYYIHQIRHTKSQYLRNARLYGNRPDSSLKLSPKWHYMVDAPFKIHNYCCNVMKKEPLARFEGQGGTKPFVGMMAVDGQKRTMTYLKTGCNAFELKHPMSIPLGFWTEPDVWQYIRQLNVPYSSIYDMGYDRTGCIFCMFGVHLEPEPNRFQMLEHTHPKLHAYCMDKLCLREVLEYMKVPWRNTQMELCNRVVPRIEQVRGM